jgi:hypothetical protein
MDVFVANSRVRLKDSDLLGEGGEARVFRWKNCAVKVFHTVSPGNDSEARVRAAKLEKLARFPTGLPRNVLGPIELVKDQAGHVIGFVMQAVSEVDDASRLAQRSFRENTISNNVVMTLFRQLEDTVQKLHARNVIVGDLNDGNVLVQPASQQVFIIDADSMQFSGFACSVGHERFLDPRLYGVDLSSGPRFDAGTDWYAFAVMLFSSLLYVHPYGGTHAKLNTMLRRAEARHPVMKTDVVLPRVAAPWKTLSDDALHWFSQTFERDVRVAPSKSVLEQVWSTCSCGVTHARPVCPSCQAMGPLPTKSVMRVKGRCAARILFETSGRVIAAKMQGGVKYVFEERGVVRREDGAVVLPRPLLPQERIGLAGASTWVVSSRGAMERHEHGKLVERAQTGVRSSEPTFATAAAVTYRTENEWLIEQGTGRRVGQVLEGQTWLWTGERLGLGFYRAGGMTVPFLVRSGQSGVKQLSNIRWTGRVVAADSVFDARHGLLTVTAEHHGRDVVHRWLVSEDGALLATSIGGRSGHAALLGGRVVLGSDEGLVAMKLDSGVLVEAACFSDTQTFVSAQDELLPQSDGSLVVVTSKELVQLSLS